MDKGLVNINWDNIEEYSNEDISYFLFLEGKSLEVISKIRNIDRLQVQNHIINGKIKYRYLVKSNNMSELLKTIGAVVKDEKIQILKVLKEEDKRKLATHIKENYVEIIGKDKETAIWIIGEIGDISSENLLMRAAVNNHINVRRMAISAMGKIGHKKFENILIRALEDENQQVIAYSIKALTKLKSLDAEKKIKAIYNSTNKEYLKRAAENFILELKGKDEKEG